jgi:hypothetical protein
MEYGARRSRYGAFGKENYMSLKSSSTTRRTVILSAAGLSALPFLVQPKRAEAAGAMAQSVAKYQAMPKGNAQCSKCNYFLPGATPTATGQCKVVAGAISPNGWCQMFAAKHG